MVAALNDPVASAPVPNCLSCGYVLADGTGSRDGYGVTVCPRCGLRRQLIGSASGAGLVHGERPDGALPSRVAFDATGAGRALRGYGWLPPERWGCWSKDRFALVTLPCRERVPATLRLALRVVAGEGAASAFCFELYLQARLVGTYALGPGPDHEVEVRTPLAPAASGDAIEIEFRNADLRAPNAWGRSESSLPVGVGLREIVVTPVAS